MILENNQITTIHTYTLHTHTWYKNFIQCVKQTVAIRPIIVVAAAVVVKTAD